MYSEQRLRHRGRKTAIAALATLALVSAAACSSKSDGETESTTAPADTESVDSTVTSEVGVTDSVPSTDVADTAAPATDATETTEAVGSPLGEPNPATDTPITIGFVTDGANASFGSDENLGRNVRSDDRVCERVPRRYRRSFDRTRALLDREHPGRGNPVRRRSHQQGCRRNGRPGVGSGWHVVRGVRRVRNPVFHLRVGDLSRSSFSRVPS